MLTGPNGRLDYRKINTVNYQLESYNDEKMIQMRDFCTQGGNDDVNITGHTWCEMGENGNTLLFGICSDRGHVCVYHVLYDICLMTKFEGENFIGLQLFELGLVACTKNGNMHFFELDNETKEFHHIRKWKYVDEEIESARKEAELVQ